MYHNLTTGERDTLEAAFKRDDRDVQTVLSILLKEAVATLSKEGVVLVKNLPVGEVPPTETKVRSADNQRKVCVVSEKLLVSVAGLLGMAVAYDGERGGRMIQNLVPLQTEKDLQTGNSSGVVLEGHTELAFHPYPPDYLVLLCLRQDPERKAHTLFLKANHLKDLLPDHLADILYLHQFRTSIDQSWLGPEVASEKGTLPRVMSVLGGDLQSPDIIYDQDLMTGTTTPAEEALKILSSKLKEGQVFRSVALEKGDLLILDNRKVIHARSSFPAYHDGNDRWLQRILVIAQAKADAAKASGALKVDNVISYKFHSV